MSPAWRRSVRWGEGAAASAIVGLAGGGIITGDSTTAEAGRTFCEHGLEVSVVNRASRQKGFQIKLGLVRSRRCEAPEEHGAFAASHAGASLRIERGRRYGSQNLQADDVGC